MDLTDHVDVSWRDPGSFLKGRRLALYFSTVVVRKHRLILKNVSVFAKAYMHIFYQQLRMPELSFPFKNNILTSLLYGFVGGKKKLVREVVVMDSLRPTYSRVV